MQDKPTNCCTTGKNCYIKHLYLLSFIPLNGMIYALSSAEIGYSSLVHSCGLFSVLHENLPA